MDPRCVVFEIHEAFKDELPTSGIREWTTLARLERVMPVKMALQRILTAEITLLFIQGQRDLPKAFQALERPAWE